MSKTENLYSTSIEIAIFLARQGLLISNASYLGNLIVKSKYGDVIIDHKIVQWRRKRHRKYLVCVQDDYPEYLKFKEMG